MNVQIKQILNSHYPLLKAVLAAAGMSLALSMPVAQAKQTSNDNANWGQWKALGEGYVGRRRQPPKLDLPRSERQLEHVQLRLKNLLRNKQDLLISLEGLSGKEAAKVQKKHEKLEKQIANAISKAAIRKAAFASEGNTVSALWLHTGGEGLYRVSLKDLAAMLDQPVRAIRNEVKKGALVLTTAENIDSATADRAVSWHYEKSTDSLLFVGKAYDTFYSDQNAYKLSLEGKQSDKASPMKVKNSSAAKSAGLQSPFRESLHFEEEPHFRYMTWAVPDEPDTDFWFWQILFGKNYSTEISLNVPDPASTGTAQLRVSLRGFTMFGSANEHEIFAELNGVPVGGSIAWDGFQVAELVADFDQGILDPSGDNTLVLKQGGATTSGEILDYIEIDYQRLPVAQGGRLWLHDAAEGTQLVTGFNSQDIYVIESPDGEAVMRKDLIIEPWGDGWSVSFDAVDGADYFLSEASAIAATGLQPDYNAGLRNPSNSADYMIIAPRDFSQSAKAMAAYRSYRYSNIKIVWLDDIYNEFSAGHEDPAAIARFMTNAVNEWSTAPAAVLLLGKGSLDQKDRMGYGDSFIPLVMTANPWSLTSSDSRLLGFEDNPPFAIGRLPITNDEEGLAYIDKLRTHESAIAGNERYEAVLVADNKDPSAGDFPANSALLRDRLLNTLGFTKVTELYHPEKNVKEELNKTATWETGYLSYNGHGATTQLGDEKFLTLGDVPLLQNSIYPVFTALTCAASNDAHPGQRSIASSLVVNPTGGAIAAVAPTGKSVDGAAQALGNALVDNYYGTGSTIGGALSGAKAETSGLIADFMPRMYSIIGEPAVYGR